MSVCRPGCACIISLRCIEPDPGPVAITSMGTDHDYGPVVLQGQSRAWVNVGLRLAAAVECARTSVVDQGSAASAVGSGGDAGSGGTDSGLRRRRRLGQWKLRYAALTAVLG